MTVTIMEWPKTLHRYGKGGPAVTLQAADRTQYISDVSHLEPLQREQFLGISVDSDEDGSFSAKGSGTDSPVPTDQIKTNPLPPNS